MLLLVSPDGTVRCVYAELLDLTTLGQPVIRRGSHVEPDSAGRWWADLAPVQGPRLGPFDRRTEALQAEQGWLEANWLVPSAPPTS